MNIFLNSDNYHQDDKSNYCPGDVKMVDLVVLGSDNHFPAGKPITGDHLLVPVLRQFVETNSPSDRQLVIDGHGN